VLKSQLKLSNERIDWELDRRVEVEDFKRGMQHLNGLITHRFKIMEEI
jgi:hypothetical protein